MFAGFNIFSHSANLKTNLTLDIYIKELINAGAGEIFVNSIDRDGSMMGYDLELISYVAQRASVPVIACGGAGTLNHFKEAIKSGASAVSAGSMFVFYGKHRAVLINYPTGLKV